MDLEERLNEFKTRYRKASLPENMRQHYEQVLAFVDAGTEAENITTFCAELASLLESNLDVLFPLADREDELDPKRLFGEEQYEQVQNTLRSYEYLEGNVEEAILNRVPGHGDETLCVLPAPFKLSTNEESDPGVLGSVIAKLLELFLHPTLLIRTPPHRPSEDLYDRIVVLGSSLHNILRLIRCTVGICPEGSSLNIGVATDQRFMSSMRELIEESEEFDETKTEAKMKNNLITNMERKLRQAEDILGREHDISLSFKIHDGAIESLIDESPYLEEPPTLLSVPLHFSGGGYDPNTLTPLFRRFTSTEVLTI